MMITVVMIAMSDNATDATINDYDNTCNNNDDDSNDDTNITANTNDLHDLP